MLSIERLQGVFANENIRGQQASRQTDAASMEGERTARSSLRERSRMTGPEAPTEPAA